MHAKAWDPEQAVECHLVGVPVVVADASGDEGGTGTRRIQQGWPGARVRAVMPHLQDVNRD